MRDATPKDQVGKIKWRKDPEIFVACINKGQDDYVELLQCNRKHFILRGWEVEAHYSCKGASMRDLPRFVDIEIKSSLNSTQVV